MLVAAAVLLPLPTGEILNNNMNIGWWFFFVAFWALVTRPRTTTDAVLAGVVFLLATGTEPLVALLLPLAVVQVLVVRADLRQEAPVMGLLLGLAYQGIGLVKTNGSWSTYTMAGTHGVVQALELQGGWGWLSGSDLSNRLVSSSHATVWQAGGYLLLAAVVEVTVVLRHRAALLFVVTAVSFAMVTFIIPVIVGGVGPDLVRSSPS